MSRKKRKGMEPDTYDAEQMIDADATPGSEGGISDEETMQARGSDSREQELELPQDETVKRKRASIEQSSVDEERPNREEVA